MTVEEAGRRGGLKTSEAHGELFFREIGRKGGESRGNKITATGTKGSLGTDTKSHVHRPVEKAKLNP